MNYQSTKSIEIKVIRLQKIQRELASTHTLTQKQQQHTNTDRQAVKTNQPTSHLTTTDMLIR